MPPRNIARCIGMPTDAVGRRSTLDDEQRPTAATVGVGRTGDAARGKTLFEKRCTGCHAMEGRSGGTEAGRSIWQERQGA